MSPLVVVFAALAGFYLLGRFAERHINAITSATDFDGDEGMDTWAAIWESVYAEDELERWASLPPRGHA